jgi:hypothetical protein
MAARHTSSDEIHSPRTELQQSIDVINLKFRTCAIVYPPIGLSAWLTATKNAWSVAPDYADGVSRADVESFKTQRERNATPVAA